MHLRGFGLKDRSLTGHNNGFIHRANLERDIHTVYIVRRNGYIGLLECLEPLLAYLQGVDPALEIGKAVAPVVISDDLYGFGWFPY